VRPLLFFCARSGPDDRTKLTVPPPPRSLLSPSIGSGNSVGNGNSADGAGSGNDAGTINGNEGNSAGSEFLPPCSPFHLCSLERSLLFRTRG